MGVFGIIGHLDLGGGIGILHHLIQHMQSKQQQKQTTHPVDAQNHNQLIMRGSNMSISPPISRWLLSVKNPFHKPQDKASTKNLSKPINDYHNGLFN